MTAAVATTKTTRTSTTDPHTVVEDGRTYRVLPLTDEQRSMIASAFVNGTSPTEAPSQRDRRAYRRWRSTYQNRGLCCARDRADACAQIVGEEFSDALHEFAYEGLGCCYLGDPEEDEICTREQTYLDMIASLDELRYEVVN